MSRSTQDWRYRLSIAALRTVAMIPLPMLYALSDFAAFILRDVVRYRRGVVHENMRRVFPDAPEKTLQRWDRQFYQHFCDNFIEAVKLLHISDEEVDKRIQVVGADIVDRYIRQGHSVIMYLGHYGNWEWVTDVVRHFRSNPVCGQIYHPLQSPTFDAVMLRIRSRFGSESIPMRRTLRRLLEIERDGNKFVVGFISDQRPSGSPENQHWMDFLGIESPFIVGGEEIGQRINARYVYTDVEPLKRGHYRITFRELTPDPEDLASGIGFPYSRKYMRLLENTIRRDPPYWLWTHKRFKWKRPATATTDQETV